MARQPGAKDSDQDEDDWAEVTPFLTRQLQRACASLPSAAPVTSLPLCPDCGSKMTTRINKSDNGWFLGCSRHPACIGTLPHPSGRFPEQPHSPTASSKAASVQASSPPTPNVSKPKKTVDPCPKCNSFSMYVGGNGSARWKKCQACGHCWDKQPRVLKGEEVIKKAVNVMESGNVVAWRWYRMVLWAFKLLQKAELREADKRFLGMIAWRKRVEVAAEAAFRA